MSDMTDHQDDDLETLETALMDADPADAPQIAEQLAATLGDQLDATQPMSERPGNAQEEESAS